jgi:hypothetical protein
MKTLSKSTERQSTSSDPTSFSSEGITQAQGFGYSSRLDEVARLYQKKSFKETIAKSKQPELNLQIHVTTSKSKLIHTKAGEEGIRKYFGEGLGLDLHKIDPATIQSQRRKQRFGSWFA